MDANKKKMIIEYSIYGAAGFAVGVVVYFLYMWLFGGSSAPAPVTVPAPAASNDTGNKMPDRDVTWAPDGKPFEEGYWPVTSFTLKSKESPIWNKRKYATWAQ